MRRVIEYVACRGRAHDGKIIAGRIKPLIAQLQAQSLKLKHKSCSFESWLSLLLLWLWHLPRPFFILDQAQTLA
jgi:hypothetical protein